MENTGKMQGLLKLQKIFLEREEFKYVILYGNSLQKVNERHYPIYIDNKDEFWYGYDSLAMPDESCIKELNDGRFEIEDYHYEDENVILDSIDDVVNHYLARVLVLEDILTFDEKPLVFRKCYKDQLIKKANMINVFDEIIYKKIHLNRNKNNNDSQTII